MRADLSDPSALAQALDGVAPELVAVTAWTRQDTEAENIAVNGGAVRNLLGALEPAGSLRHVALMTGLKHYLGPFEAYAVGTMADTPFREEEPRLDSPNFYYAQEDELFASAERNGFTWSVHRAHTVFGFAIGNAMNMVATLCVYATICKERGLPFVFPGSETQWNGVTDVTDAELLAEQILWAGTSESGQNEAFNIANGDVFRWRWLWPQVAAYFGLEWEGFEGEPRTLEKAMGGMEETWQAIADKHGLVENALSRVASWWHTDGDLGREHRGPHRHEQEPEGRLHRRPRHPRQLLRLRRALPAGAGHSLSRPVSSMWALMVVCGWWAASSAATASSMTKRWVTIADRSMPLLARNLSVSGHTPGDPMEPVMRSSLDWIRPELRRCLLSDVDADVGDPALEGHELERTRHHRGPAAGLDHHVGATSVR